ncbi:hypothetical protein RUM43_005412 [Polyplax serrata]|uniref:Uncharacterized protein n=1 Tax=Polyplax serrata TaxID=468196 RepID=A0AAN8RUN3_POLSC
MENGRTDRRKSCQGKKSKILMVRKTRKIGDCTSIMMRNEECTCSETQNNAPHLVDTYGRSHWLKAKRQKAQEENTSNDRKWKVQTENGRRRSAKPDEEKFCLRQAVPNALVWAEENPGKLILKMRKNEKNGCAGEVRRLERKQKPEMRNGRK